jgi:DNA gyrase subunit B/topoisomerase-4 subunit B
MPFRVLSQTTLDPKFRTLLKVEIDNNHDAHTAFQELLGKDASSRYQFIMDKADQTIAEELDV